MNIDKQTYCNLLKGIDLPEDAKVLISWREAQLDRLVQAISPGVRLDYVMEMNLEKLLQIQAGNDDGSYDFIFDNGLLSETNMAGDLLRSLGMQLKPAGRMRAVFAESMNPSLVGVNGYAGNFDSCMLVKGSEPETSPFYIVEFSGFQRQVTWLQSLYAPDVRRELAFLLQRIDFGIRAEESVEALRYFLVRHHISSEDLRIFVDKVVIHKKKVYEVFNFQE